MEWLGWIVPVLFVAGFILKQLAGKAENNQPPERMPRRRPEADAPPREVTPKRPPEQIRRFLEEMRRQREGLPPEPEPEPTAQVERPRPVPRPERVPPKPVRQRPPVPPRPQRVSEVRKPP